jgi:hypothetical protein
MSAWEDGFGHSVTGDRHAALYKDFRIYFTHMPTGKSTSFAGMITKFDDAFRSSWSENDYYGRMDQVATFQNTRRKISFSLDVVSDDSVEAASNMERFQRLTQFLYPVYEAALEGEDVGANTMTSPPLIGIKFGNLIQNRTTGQGGDMLVGYLDGINFAPDNDAGWWYANSLDNTSLKQMVAPGSGSPDELAAFKAGGFLDLDDNVAYEAKPVNLDEYTSVDGPVMLPKIFKMDCGFNVLHTHPLGWTTWGEWTMAAQDYPYEAHLLSTTTEAAVGQKVEIEQSFSYKEAKVPRSVENDILCVLFGTC